MSKPRSTIKIDTSPVSDSYRSLADEKLIEFSATRRDVAEDGSFNSLMGGLISFRVLRANGGDIPEDKLIVTVYRTDPNVEVRGPEPQPVTPEPEAAFEPGELIEYTGHRVGPGGNSGQWVPGTFGHYTEGSDKHVYVRTLGRPHNRVLSLRSEVRKVPAGLISAARSWAADCTWREDGEDIADMSDAQIVAGVQRHFAGGWAAFVAAGGA